MAADIERLTRMVGALKAATATSTADDQTLWDALRTVSALKEQVEIELLRSAKAARSN
jgi:hypothetical protein